ncbi:DUF4258 domain-containing protein [Thermoflexus sp.]|uniref:DUF4258 domain-containing protein n=1 Tax=Thermoflexus sp. TaxID=1969742 RepID=UPI003C0F11FB
MSMGEVESELKTGETIATYPDDEPYPSRLILGWVGGRPLHLVVADDPARNVRIVIPVYEPDPALWESDFRRRRKCVICKHGETRPGTATIVF